MYKVYILDFIHQTFVICEECVLISYPFSSSRTKDNHNHHYYHYYLLSSPNQLPSCLACQPIKVLPQPSQSITRLFTHKQQPINSKNNNTVTKIDQSQLRWTENFTLSADIFFSLSLSLSHRTTASHKYFSLSLVFLACWIEWVLANCWKGILPVSEKCLKKYYYCYYLLMLYKYN